MSWGYTPHPIYFDGGNIANGPVDTPSVSSPPLIQHSMPPSPCTAYRFTSALCKLAWSTPHTRMKGSAISGPRLDKRSWTNIRFQHLSQCIRGSPIKVRSTSFASTDIVDRRGSAHTHEVSRAICRLWLKPGSFGSLSCSSFPWRSRSPLSRRSPMCTRPRSWLTISQR
jgi:hypothetical protein